MHSLFGGDFRFLWPENIKDLAHLPSAWDPFLNAGLGTANLTLFLNSYVGLTTSFSYLGLSWITIVLLFWILPVFLGSFLFTFLLFRYLFPHLKPYAFLAGSIYAVNTYILMVVFGGQMGIGLAYAVVPLVLLAFIRSMHQTTLANSLLAGLALGLQILFDPRFVYMTMFGVFGYWLFIMRKFSIQYLFYCFFLPILVSLLLHAFWLFPLFFAQKSSAVSELGSSNEFTFFSFADLPHTLSLLHPNWPENIFGKTYFMQWEFLILPLLAFSSLLFIEPKIKKTILFFSFLGLFGAFLAKGGNPPFGEINQFLFSSFPGMTLFRDPTKFYVLVVLAYSILIPFSLWKISEWIVSTRKFSIFNFQFSVNSKLFNFQKVLFVVFILFWLFSLRSLLVSNAFQIREVPNSYVQLKDFIVSQDQFFRTLWVPQWQRYGFSSANHPALASSEFFATASASTIVQSLQKEQTKQQLQESSVKYVIVPFDSEGEIFLDDRKYDEKSYQKTLQEVKKIPWLQEEKDFGKIVVFKLEGSRDHFWTTNPDTTVNYKKSNDTLYEVRIQNAKKGELLLFSEGFDPGWKSKIHDSSPNEGITSMRYNGRLNSFVLPQDGDYTLEVYYAPQKWVTIGGWISLVSLVLIIGLLVRKIKLNHKI